MVYFTQFYSHFLNILFASIILLLVRPLYSVYVYISHNFWPLISYIWVSVVCACIGYCFCNSASLCLVLSVDTYPAIYLILLRVCLCVFFDYLIASSSCHSQSVKMCSSFPIIYIIYVDFIRFHFRYTYKLIHICHQTNIAYSYILWMQKGVRTLTNA